MLSTPMDIRISRLPAVPEMEEALLGAILLGTPEVADIAQTVHPDDFYVTRHAVTYETMLALYEQHKTVDTVSLAAALDGKNRLAEFGGTGWLYGLMSKCPDVAHALTYAQMIAFAAFRLRAIKTAERIVRLAVDEDRPTAEIERDIHGAITALGSVQETNQVYSMRDTLMQLMDTVERMSTDGRYIGIPTGFYDYDELLDGWQDKTLNIVGGRPGMGKSAFLTSTALNLALRGQAVYMWSGEMTAYQQTLRLQAALSGVPSRQVQRGYSKYGGLTEDIYSRKVLPAVGKLSEMNIFIDDKPAITPAQLASRIRRVQADRGIRFDLIMIDYLQLMYPNRRSQSRVEEVSDISRNLKLLAMEYCPVVAAVQLNRGVESRQNKRPYLADLRESGAIEQDADTVTFLYRDEVYDPDSVDKNVIELIVGKSRNGAVGTVRMGWQPELTRIVNLVKHDVSNL